MKEIRNKIGTVLKFAVLIVVSIFTAFPFLWMILSALKTKAEVMDVSALLPSSPQWSNFVSVIFNSPLPGYIWNS
ncbi:MAG: carbohydrate ABC transporter permease, partial [Lachnospiraceae bacterium]|nr:carbohydrate ABC transporter permease [Lachnospiraceae bacterium]